MLIFVQLGKEDIQSLSPLVGHILQNIGIISFFSFSSFRFLFLSFFLFILRSPLPFLFFLTIKHAELNTNEIDVQVVSFETLAKFAKFETDEFAHVGIPTDLVNRVRQVCEGSKFMAEDRKELKVSIERVMFALEKLDK